MTQNRVDALYDALKAMAAGFRLRPGERLNEVALARDLGASRTPLREALNRLASEGLVETQPGKGFFAPRLDAGAIHNLYELRETIEAAAVRLAVARAPDAAVAALRDDLLAHGMTVAGLTVGEAVDRDEAFHLGLARLSGNAEFARHLARVNARIRLVRWVDMADRAHVTKGEHRAVVEAVAARDADAAERLLRAHIARRLDQVAAAVRLGAASIYTVGAQELSERRLGAEDDR